ncbi:MFS type sugar transporter [Rickettsia philipii str. 364D]|uniref:MFS type sugar transporter n=1 Tax=Rickettsia philipii (strain 364D) TaxID=481009 RepID=H6PT10_RICP3|nr:MFS type sugar transporter [Rickettsia philipii str. 364D]
MDAKRYLRKTLEQANIDPKKIKVILKLL